MCCFLDMKELIIGATTASTKTNETIDLKTCMAQGLQMCHFLCVFLDFSSLLFRSRAGTDIPPTPQSPFSMAAKSQRITESGDYIAIHSYYPRGRKHEPFRAAANISSRSHSPPPPHPSLVIWAVLPRSIDH